MKFSTKVQVFGLLGLGGAVAGGCGASPPPRELVDARAAYSRAQSGPASQLKPDALVDAKNALSRAERAYAASADEREIRTLGYVAERKAEVADIQGHDVLNVQEQTLAENEIQQMTSQQLSATQQQLQREQGQRTEAQRQAQEALDRLQNGVRGSTVTIEERGTVITLPGQVLFAVGKSTLLPNARQSLTQVADALRVDPNRRLVVEGHTDSTGSDDKNQILSQQRAQAVKSFLVSRGMAADQIATKGEGASHPVANNDSPEGRANNRRVEIVILPEAQK
jgi:outer membrane protein OmpA-like peptidoglycan-associated protein